MRKTLSQMKERGCVPSTHIPGKLIEATGKEREAGSEKKII